MKSQEKLKKALIFRNGQLGDTLASIPALWALRENFKHHKFTLLYDKHINSSFINPEVVLNQTGLIEEFFHYEVNEASKLKTYAEYLKLFFRLLKEDFDLLIYLAPSERPKFQVSRDIRFFKALGIKTIIGAEGLRGSLYKKNIYPAPFLEKESSFLLKRLKESGVIIPPKGKIRSDLNLTKEELVYAKEFLSTQTDPDNRTIVALGIGSKFDEKKWHTENYIYVVRELIKIHDIYPVVFGGPEDTNLGEYVIKNWGRGAIAAGRFNIRESAALMSFCHLYIGNDTGTMHLASASGVNCVSIFSARDYPGAWYPFGENNIEVRAKISCEGKENSKCTTCKGTCLRSVSKEEVLKSCLLILK